LTKFHTVVGILVKTSVCLPGEVLQTQGNLKGKKVVF